MTDLIESGSVSAVKTVAALFGGLGALEFTNNPVDQLSSSRDLVCRISSREFQNKGRVEEKATFELKIDMLQYYQYPFYAHARVSNSESLTVYKCNFCLHI